MSDAAYGTQPVAREEGMANNDGFWSAQSMWLGLGVVAAMMFGWKAFGPQSETSAAPVAHLNVGSGAEARVESLTRAQCLARPDRLWVVMSNGVECISYVASTNVQGAGNVLVFLDGDVGEDRIAGAAQEKSRESWQSRIGPLSSRLGVPVVVIGRPGLMGSSGFHLLGGVRDESHVIDATMDALRERLGFRRVAMAGQSGGARIIAQLMVIGRRDIACAAMGSGAFDVPRRRGGGTTYTNIFGDPGSRFLVPMLRAGEIPVVSSRRSFVIGDPRDTVAPFSEQKAWADKLGQLNHHVQLIEVKATDPEHHGAAQKALMAAAMCLQDASDGDIRKALEAD
jgi:pimeloyl-ACP methyl ester carboxylesterase